MNAKIILKRNKIDYFSYKIEKCSGICKLVCNDYKNIKLEEIDISNLHEDIKTLGKTIFLAIEKCNTISEVLRKKDFVITGIKKTPIVNNGEVEYGAYSVQLTNGMFNIAFKTNIDYSFPVIEKELLSFFNKYGIPELDNNEAEYTYYSDQNIEYKKKEISLNKYIYTSIMIFLYSQFIKIQRSNKASLNSFSKKFFNINLKKYPESEKYINNFFIYSLEEIMDSLSDEYRFLEIPTSNKLTYETDNLLLAEIKYVTQNKDIFYLKCARCGKLCLSLIDHLCDYCYDEDPNYYKKKNRNRNYEKANKLIQNLKEINNATVNKEIEDITKGETPLKNPTKTQIKRLEALNYSYQNKKDNY